MIPPPIEETPLTSPLPSSTGWLDFTARLRRRIDALHRKASGTPLEQDVGALANDTIKLLDHVALLHRATERWLSETRQSTGEGEVASYDLNDPEIQRAAVSIQREQHEQSGHPMEFIKSLLMWVETPEERASVVADTPTHP